MVEGVVDNLRRQAETRGGGPIVGKQRLQAAILLVRLHIRKTRRVAHLLQQEGAILLQIVNGLGLQCVLVLCVGLPASYAYVLNQPQIGGRARNGCKLWAKPVHDLLRAYAFIEGLERDKREAAIGGSLSAGKSHRVLHSGVCLDDVDGLPHRTLHRVERGVLRPLHSASQHSGILLREESLRDSLD